MEVSFRFLEFPGCESLTELMSTIVQRVGDEIDRTHLPRLMVCWNIIFVFKFLFPLILTAESKS